MKKHFLINEDDKAYHLHDGVRNFLVAKKGIKGDLHEKIKKLPKYNEGGIVEEEEPSFLSNLQTGLNDFVNASNSAAASAQEKGMRDLAARNPPGSLMGNPIPVEETPVVEDAVVEEPISVPEMAPQVMPNAAASPNLLGQFQQNQNMQMQGIKQSADIQSKLAEDQAKVLEAAAMPEFEEKLKQRFLKLDQESEKVGQEIEAFKAAAAEDKIDPNRVWNNMSTGNKVLATIGLILGGAGSGGQASNNAALNVLNSTIDRDIKAQQANSDKKMSLYKMNLDRYKDIQTAQEMTRMQLNSMTQGKIAALAARSNSDLAKANAQMMIGQLGNQNMELGQKLMEHQRTMAIRDTFASAKPGQIPTEQAINYLVPKEDRKAAREELQNVNGYKNAVKSVASLFDEIKDIGVSGTIPFTEAKARLEKVKANAESVIRNSMKGQGALSDRDMENVIKLMPGTTDTAPQRKQKMQGIMNILQTKVQAGTPTLTGYRIPVDLNVSTLTPQQEGLAKWAAANPKDPRSKEIKKRLGL